MQPVSASAHVPEHSRAFSAWRPVDDLILTAMAHARSSVDDMAERLGRTPSEVESQLERLNLA